MGSNVLKSRPLLPGGEMGFTSLSMDSLEPVSQPGPQSWLVPLLPSSWMHPHFCMCVFVFVCVHVYVSSHSMSLCLLSMCVWKRPIYCVISVPPIGASPFTVPSTNLMGTPALPPPSCAAGGLGMWAAAPPRLLCVKAWSRTPAGTNHCFSLCLA